MRKNFVLTQKDFDNLLRWLSSDREAAGEIYERVRNGLMRFFLFRGCSDPEALVDETINRVATKVSTFDSGRGIKTITYFYGFAANIYRESLSARASKELQLEENYPEIQTSFSEADGLEDMRLDCLDRCLGTLSSGEKELIITYFSEEKKEKILIRSELAKKMNLNVNALYLKVHRLKSVLKGCVENCQKERAL